MSRVQTAVRSSTTCDPRSIAAAAILMIAGSTTVFAQDKPVLRLKTGQVNANTLSNAKSRQARPQRIPSRMVLISETTLTEDQKRAIEDTGARIGDYLPDNAFIVDLRNARFDTLRSLSFVTHLVEFEDAWKIDGLIGKRVPQTDARKALSAAGLIATHVYLFPGEELNAVTQQIEDQSTAEIVRTELVDDRYMLQITGTEQAVRSLAKIDGVQWIESAPEVTPRNNSNRWIVQSNVNGFFPVYDAGIHGENQIVAVMDGRVNVNHCAFTDPEGDPFGDDHRKIQAYNSSTSNPDFHGTHVAGTVLGNNNADDHNRGVAYEARLIFDTTPSFSFSALSNRLNTHYGQGASIHTNSWGDDFTTAYTGMSRAIDTFSYNNDDNLVIFAVTNGSALRTPENAKNCLAVGATRDNSSQGSHCSGGVGPTSDGRRKPEIYAPGCNTQSAQWNTSCGTFGLTGTSMAAPAIAGTAALTKQYFEDGFYPTGFAESDDGFVPSGTLIKATLLNSTVDMTGISGYPSNLEGWGRVLLDNALYFNGDDRKLIIEDVRNASNDALATDDTHELKFTVNSLTQPLKVTMVFHDAPATPNSSFAPVNDLDLEVVLPTGDTLLGNNISNGISFPGGSADAINNVEMVMLPAAVLGEYTVRVKATAVNNGPQGFAIVVTGDVAEAGPAGCNDADLAEPYGVLNFFDVSEFLSLFNNQDPAADFVDDGMFNFFDVSEFLIQFNTGCP